MKESSMNYNHKIKVLTLSLSPLDFTRSSLPSNSTKASERELQLQQNNWPIACLLAFFSFFPPFSPPLRAIHNVFAFLIYIFIPIPDSTQHTRERAHSLRQRAQQCHRPLCIF